MNAERDIRQEPWPSYYGTLILAPSYTAGLEWIAEDQPGPPGETTIATSQAAVEGRRADLYVVLPGCTPAAIQAMQRNFAKSRGRAEWQEVQ